MFNLLYINLSTARKLMIVLSTFFTLPHTQRLPRCSRPTNAEIEGLRFRVVREENGKLNNQRSS